MKVDNHQRQEPDLHAGRDHYRCERKTKEALRVPTLEFRRGRSLKENVTDVRGCDLSSPVPFAPKQSFGKEPEPASAGRWIGRLACRPPRTHTMHVLHDRDGERDNCQHGKKGQLKRRIEETFG